MLDDKKIKDLLQNAEEPVPAGVWPAVRSRLVSASSPAWHWAGLTLAAAAAIVAGIFLIGTSDNTENIVPKSGIELLTQTPETGIELPIRTQGAKTESFAQVTKTTVPSKEQKKGFTPDRKEQPVTPDTSKVKKINSSPEKPKMIIIDTSARKRYYSEKSAETSDDDSFDKLLKEEEMKDRRGRIQLAFGGSVRGNSPKGSGSISMSSGFSSIPEKDIITEKSVSNYGVPVSVGVGLRFYLSKKLSIGTGIDWSLLTRTFDGSYTSAGTIIPVNGSVQNNLHYIGIPVKLYYGLIETTKLDLYAYMGGEAEWCISNRFDFRPSDGGSMKSLSNSVSQPQFSANAGIGVQFKLGEKIGLYLDPGVSYYFYGSQPKSIRTERPLTFMFNAGLRFNIQ